MPDRVRLAWTGSPTPEQAQQAVIGYTACFGTYTVDATAKTVTHHRKGALNAADVGGDAVRRYEFLGNDRLVLTVVGTATTRLVWERVTK